MTLTAVGYARISRDDAAEGRGVARQTEDVLAVCERHGWTPLEVITDNDASASRYARADRPGYDRLVDLIRTGAVDRAVVYNLDRLLRQPRQLEELIDLCEERGAAFELHTVTGRVDLRDAGGRFTARTLVNVAAMESDNTSRRLRRCYDQRAADGLPHGPRAFGYEPDGLTVREPEAALIREAAAAVLDGTATWRSTARRWNDLGVAPPQRARSWRPESVKAVLTGPHAAGLRVHRGEVVGPGAWPAIIDRDIHDRLAAHASRPGPRTPPRRTPFTGLVTDVNGTPLDRDSHRQRPMYRGRRRPGREAAQVSIAAEPLERFITELLFAAIEDGSLSRVAAEQAARRDAAPDLGAIEEDLRALAEDHGAGRISRAEWLAARGPLEARAEAARAAVDAAAAGPDAALTVDLRARWPDLDVDARRAVLRHMFERVEIRPARTRGGPQPMVDGIGRLDVTRVVPRWRT